MDVPRTQAKSRGQLRVALIVGGALVVLVGAAFLGFDPAVPAIDGRALMIAEVERGTFVIDVRGPGTLVPEQIRWITALTAGRVEQRFLDPGQAVEADSVILQLSNPDVELEALDAERQLTAARAALLALRTGLEEQRLNQVSTVATAKAAYGAATRDATASEGLVAKNFLSSHEASKRMERAEETAARLAAEKGRLALLLGTMSDKLALQEEQVARLSEIAAFQRARVESMTVRAGAAGVLQDTDLEVGQWVQPGETLAKVAEPSGLKAVLRIPETLARDVALGQSAEIDTRNGIAEGRVFRIDPNVQNGSVSVHVRLVGEVPRGARSDLSVEGTIETARVEDALHIVRPAFSQAEASLSLFRLEDDGRFAARVNVRLGRVSANAAEVASGARDGERFVISDMSRWDTFDRVEIE